MTGKVATRLVMFILGGFISGGCGGTDSRPVDMSDVLGEIQIADHRGLLSFVNDQSLVDVALLDDTCRLRADAARNIVWYRDGGDGQVGTSDDNLFNSLAELDAVDQVGQETLRALYVCAASHDYLFADRPGLLSFVNDYRVADFVTLDEGCGLRADSTANILAHRDGPDRIPGSADDDLFDNLYELDAVAMVGLATLGQLYQCAADLHYVQDWTPPGTTEVRVVDDLDAVPAGLREVITEDLALRARQLADAGSGFPVEFEQAVTYLSGRTIVGYEVSFSQRLSWDDTARFWIKFLLDADFQVQDSVSGFAFGGRHPRR